MFSVNELMEQIDRLKSSKEIVANNFLSLSDLEKFSREPDSRLAFNEKAIALFCRDNGIDRLHFHLASIQDAPALGKLLAVAPKKPFVVDCIGKQPYLDELESALCGIGFETYVHMSRWRTGHIDFLSEAKLRYMYESNDFRKAVPEDTDEIHRILYDTFDPYYSQLPTKEFLLELIHDGLVFCVVKKGHIVAVQCLQRIGRNGIYSYELAVLPDYRNSGIGCYIWQYALNHFPECRNYTSWTDDKNTSVNRLHRMMGFSYDGLQDHVVIYR